MKAALAAALVLLVAGCTSSPPKPAPTPAPKAGAVTPVTLSDAERATVEVGARSYLQNPPDAVFRTMLASKRADGATTVCGYVNVNNGGDKPYIGTLAGGVFSVTAIGGTADETIAVQKACQSSRVYI